MIHWEAYKKDYQCTRYAFFPEQYHTTEMNSFTKETEKKVGKNDRKIKLKHKSYQPFIPFVIDVMISQISVVLFF